MGFVPEIKYLVSCILYLVSCILYITFGCFLYLKYTHLFLKKSFYYECANFKYGGRAPAANLTFVRSPGHNTCIDYVISLMLFLLYYIDIHVYVE